MSRQKGNILPVLLVLLVLFLILLIYSLNTKPNINPTSTLANPTAAPSGSFCRPNRIYVDLQACSCPAGTTKTIEVPEGGEEAVLICKTETAETTCKDDDFYAQQAMSFKYKITGNYASVSGCLADSPGSGCQEKTLNLTPAQAFYLSSGKEQSVKVSLQKIENNKAHFLFEYGAAPPACETVGGCDYVCEFVRE